MTRTLNKVLTRAEYLHVWQHVNKSDTTIVFKADGILLICWDNKLVASKIEWDRYSKEDNGKHWFNKYIYIINL